MALLKQIVSFCDKIIEETTIKINDTESILKQQLEKKEYEEIKKTIISNEAATKKTLHHQNFKKYNSFKHKPTPTVKVKKITKETGNIENRTYDKVIRAGRCPTRILSKTTNADNKHKQNIHEKLCTISSTNQFRRQRNNLSRKPSSTNTTLPSNRRLMNSKEKLHQTKLHAKPQACHKQFQKT